MITLGQVLDLIDKDRESNEIVNIMNGCVPEVKAVVSSFIWDTIENKEVESIEASNSELNVWLKK